MPDSEAIRRQFEQHILELLRTRRIDLIAEKAGNDEEWAALRVEDAKIPPELAELFRGTEIVDHPQRTIANAIAEEHCCHYVDIRVPDAASKSVAERDAAMSGKTAEIGRYCTNVLVIVGKDHQEGVASILQKDHGWKVSTQSFPPRAERESRALFGNTRNRTTTNEQREQVKRLLTVSGLSLAFIAKKVGCRNDYHRFATVLRLST